MPMYSSIKSILVLLFAFVFLTACGGGGSSTPAVTVAVPNVTVDPAGQPGVTFANNILTITAAESGVGAGRQLASFPIGDNTVTSVSLIAAAVAPRESDNGAALTVSSATDYFEAVLSEDGQSIIIRVKSGAGTIPPGTYNVVVVITNSGGEQRIETVIEVSDVAEPVITANQAFSVSESAASGAAVGTLAITNEDSAVISSIVLTDSATQLASTDFGADNEGKITVLPTASLDYDTGKTSYSLSVVVSSDGGASVAETITINLIDAADDLPEVTAKDYKVLAGRTAGTEIATLEFDRGSSAVTFALGGADAGSFTLDNNGVLTLNTTASAGTTYALTATATNSIGASNVAAINVAVIAAASYAGQTPKLMAIGDSITQGIGGKTEAAAAADIATAQTDLDAKTTAATAAADADTNVDAVITALAVPDLTAATTAVGVAETKASGTAAATAVTALKTAIEALVATPADTTLQAAADTAATAAKTATSEVLTAANTAKTDAESALRNAKTATVQRFSYRKELGELRDASQEVSFEFIGTATGPVSSVDGKPLFADNKNEGYSGIRIRQIYDVAAEYTCTQERFDANVCSNLGGAITGGPHQAAANTTGKSFLHYSLEDNDVPDIALVMLGTNDMAFRTSEGNPVAIAKADMEGLIAVLRESNPEMSIFVAKIPPMDNPLGYGINTASVVPFNNALQEIVTNDSHATSQLYIVDQYTDFSGGASGEVDPIDGNLHVGDGVHPNMVGEAELAENWLQAIQSVFPAVMTR